MFGLKCFLNLFADDTFLYYFDKDFKINFMNGQNDLNILSKFFKLNKLTLNVKKTKFINIHSRNKSLPSISSLNYDGPIIEEVSKFTYLGIVIDKFLIWDEHVKNLCSKLSCRVGLLKKLSYFLPHKVLLLLYYSLNHCHIENLCIAWGSACNVHLNPLQVLQNRALKFIFNLPMQFPSDLYFKTRILPIKGIFNLQTCILVKDILA